MQLKPPILIALAILSLSLGLGATYYCATLDGASRWVKDLSSMGALLASLAAAGLCIVMALTQCNSKNPPG